MVVCTLSVEHSKSPRLNYMNSLLIFNYVYPMEYGMADDKFNSNST